MKDILGRPIQVGDYVYVLSTNHASVKQIKQISSLYEDIAMVGFEHEIFNAANLLYPDVPKYKVAEGKTPCSQCIVITSQLQSNHNDYPEEYI